MITVIHAVQIRRLVAGALISIICLPSLILAAEFEPPTPEEQTVFDAKLARIQGHSSVTPNGKEVDDVIASLTNAWTSVKDCPESTKVKKIHFSVTTKLRKWDKKKVDKEISTGRVGACFARFTSSVDGDKYVNITFNIMLDPKVTVEDEKDENDPFGKLRDETLLYHELLHAQLLLNAIKSDKDWLKKVCNCNVSLDPMDNDDHTTIHPWEEEFLAAIAEGVADVSVHRPPAQKAKDADGNFVVDLGPFPADKDALTVEFSSLEEGNISVNQQDKLDLEVFEGDGKNGCPDGNLCIRGKLIDPKKPGFFLAWVDPPLFVIYFGIEEAIIIEPAIAIPTLSEWGMIIFSLLLFGWMAWVIAKRRQNITVGA